MTGNFFYSKVYKGGFDIKSLENARPRRYNSKIWWSIHKRRFNIVENKNRNTAAIGVFDSGVGGISVLRELVAQMPFGTPTEGPGPKEIKPLDKRVLVFK